MRKTLSILCMAVMLLQILTACSFIPGSEDSGDEGIINENTIETNEEGDSQVEVTEMTFVFAGGDPLVKELMSDRVQAFNSLYPEYQIIERTSASGGYLDYVLTQDAIGEFPDMLDCRDISLWADAGKLGELPESIVALLNDPPIYQGTHYVAPITYQLPSLGFFYNRRLFDELGLEEPQNWNEFELVCEVISAEGITPIVQGGKDIWHMGFLWGQMWLEQVYKVNPDWNKDMNAGEVSFTDPEPQAVINKLSSLYENGYIDEGWLATADNQLASYLVSEKGAMFFSGSWMINQVLDMDPDFELGWFPLRDEEGKINLLTSANQDGFAISAEASKDPDKAALFEAFVTFFYSKDKYGPYVSSLVMASTVKAEIDIEYNSDFPYEFARALAEADYTDTNWNGKTGDERLPGGFRNFAYKAFQDKIISGSDSMALGRLLDRQWDVEVNQLTNDSE